MHLETRSPLAVGPLLKWHAGRRPLAPPGHWHDEITDEAAGRVAARGRPEGAAGLGCDLALAASRDSESDLP